MTKEERKELDRIRRARGRGEDIEQKSKPTYKDEDKTRSWTLKWFGREIVIKITNPNK